MSESPRRRRSDDDSGGGGGGFPLFPLILVVIFAGLLLGGVLAHFFGGSKRSNSAAVAPGNMPIAIATASPTVFGTRRPLGRPTATPHVLRPSPKAAPTATPRSSPSASPHSSSSPAPHATLTPRPATAATPLGLAVASASPSPTPRAVAVVAASPTAHKTAAPAVAHAATSTPNPETAAAATAVPNYVAGGTDQAAGIVRSYLGALARGDRATATSYLSHGLPGETFMDSSARILSVHPSSSGSQYKVAADVQTSSGEYYVTFSLEEGPGGLQITDHYAIPVSPH